MRVVAAQWKRKVLGNDGPNPRSQTLFGNAIVFETLFRWPGQQSWQDNDIPKQSLGTREDYVMSRE